MIKLVADSEPVPANQITWVQNPVLTSGVCFKRKHENLFFSSIPLPNSLRNNPTAHALSGQNRMILRLHCENIQTTLHYKYVWQK